MRMRVLTTEGVRVVDLYDEWDRSIVGQHWNTISQYVKTGQTYPLGNFDWVRIEGFDLETNQDRIYEWWSLGQLQDLEIYEG